MNMKGKEFKECISYNLTLLELRKTELLSLLNRHERKHLRIELSKVERLIKYNNNLLKD